LQGAAGVFEDGRAKGEQKVDLDHKPNQNAYIESVNGRLRDECLNEHWFTSLDHARDVIKTWRREYNDETPKKILGGLTPTDYAKQISQKADTLTVSR